MKHLTLFFISSILLSCTNSVKQAETAYKSELSELIPIKGHDPVEEGVFTHPYLKHRMTKMLGEAKYDSLVLVMQDCTPIGFNNDLLYWVGYSKDNPESNSGAIVIDLINDEIYVGYEYGDAIELFTDAPQDKENPSKLANWFNRRSRIVNLTDSATTSNE